MNRTYKATGINLKSMPMGESDRLVTVLTREFGLLRLMAMGSRKHQSKLGGRSGLFVVNELMIAKGRSLDKITQAETLESYPKLSCDLRKLTAGQYLAELALNQALDDHPQEELFDVLNAHLAEIERSPSGEVLPRLIYAILQLLMLAGVAPQVTHCCQTQVILTPDFSQPDWRVGFNAALGGTLTQAAATELQTPAKPRPKLRVRSSSAQYAAPAVVATSASVSRHPHADASLPPSTWLTAPELAALQHLAQAELSSPNIALPEIAASTWGVIERTLRKYAQYHFDRPIRSASLVDHCF
jgi:DNA repair protein RecO (recombination protein O)